MTDPSPLRQSLERLSAMEWMAHKPFCAVMGQDARFGWRDGDEAVCNCGLSALLAGERRAQEEPNQDDICENCQKQSEDVVFRSGFDVPLCDECRDALIAAEPASPPAPPVAGAQEPDAWKVPFRRMMDIVCMCGDTFDSIEAFIEHGEMVHADEDIPAASRPAAPAPNEPTLRYARVFWRDEDGDVMVRCPELPGCMCHAGTLDAANALMDEAERVWLEHAVYAGQPVPRPNPRFGETVDRAAPSEQE